MQLMQALRLGEFSQLALVGAGGKTTAMFQLGREATTKNGTAVLATATTHLAVAQLGLANAHRIIVNAGDIEQLRAASWHGVMLATGPVSTDARSTGLTPEQMNGLFRLAMDRHLPLLIEADGSRRRPLKAPAEHEPVIPAWVSEVVVLAGLSAIGQPLSEDWVHRPERFAALAGVTLGTTITPEILLRVLLAEQGGLKNMPAAARRVVLLNQADTPLLQAQAGRMAQELLTRYQAVVIAALEVAGGLPPAVFAVHEPVAAVILAAGGSQRLGQPKQLLPWQGQPLVRHAAVTALAAGFNPVIVVLGAQAPMVRAALSGLEVVLVENPAWQNGQGSSVAVGALALPPESGAAVFLPCDQPLLPAALLRALIDRHQQTMAPIVAPLVDGQRANPVLFDRQTFKDLSVLSGEAGGRVLFSHYAVEWLPWHDANVLADVDTLQDYQRLLGEP